MNSMKWIPKSIVIKTKATHFDNFINRNALNYTANAVKNGAESWIKPFQKPYLVGHDKQRDPIGRVIGYRIVKSDSMDEPSNYIELTAIITDEAAIEKILDGRYYTVSVGSRSSKVLCSECNQNIVEDGLCEHRKGALSSTGNRIYWKIDQIEYTECSFVNEPADDYACIDQIDIGFGFVSYKDFLANQETLLLEGKNMEVLLMNDAVLSSAARNKLPDSAFCYVSGSGDSKVRKFPAHDAAHVRNGLARLSQAKLSESAKAKILACLKRRAKRLGITVSSDSVFSQDSVNYINSIDPLYGIYDGFTVEEKKELEVFFKENPDIDLLPEEKQESTDEITKQEVDPDKMKKEELIGAFRQLIEKHKSEIAAKDQKIAALEKQLADVTTILSEREDEVNRYIDQAALLEKRLRDAIINNIIDLKRYDTNEEKVEAIKKLESRQLQSLIDTLTDLREERLATDKSSVENKDQIKDPTRVVVVDSTKTQDIKVDPWSVFETLERPTIYF